MLVKNVYILYPPGYSGSYINWAINISDVDSQTDTVKDPLNQTASAAFGGVGTVHHHVRIPTHQSYREHVNWVLYNRPTTPKIYIINSGIDVEYEIASILNHDPTGVFIRIHDNNDKLINSYGLINCVTKWPTYLVGYNAIRGKQLTYDPFDCSKDQVARNVFVDTQLLGTVHYSSTLDYTVLETQLARSAVWFHTRNKYQPHEVNKSTYITDISINNRIFELSCLDIASQEFLNIFENIMIQSQVSDNFDLAYVKQFHNNYIKAQANLQWFDSINKWKQSGELDDYLISHSVIEACVIKEMYRNLKLDNVINWPNFYYDVKDPSWPDCNNEWDFNSLPELIQDELINVFNYVPKPSLQPTILESTLELHNTWQSKSIQEINTMYQKIVKHIG